MFVTKSRFEVLEIRMKKFIGRVLIATPLVFLFAAGVFVKGWAETLLAWGVIILFLCMIVGGQTLLDDD